MLRFNGVLLYVLLVCSISLVLGKPEDSPKKPILGFVSAKFSKAEVDKCLKEAGITPDEFNTMRSEPGKKPTTEGQCFARCLALTSGAITSDGSLDIEVLKPQLPPKIANEPKIISCWENIGKISNCQDMAKVMNCVPKDMQPQ